MIVFIVVRYFGILCIRIRYDNFDCREISVHFRSIFHAFNPVKLLGQRGGQGGVAAVKRSNQ